MNTLKTWRAERAAKKQAARERAAQIKRERDEYNETLYGRVDYACPIGTCSRRHVFAGTDLIYYLHTPRCFLHEVDMVVTNRVIGTKYAEVK